MADRSAQPIVVTGASGQLGRAVAAACSTGWPVVGLDRAGLDLERPATFLPVLRELQPAAVVNCAALTDTARCEREPALANALNAEAPAALATACRSLGTYFVQISTNEVFDGRAQQPYDEDAPTNPLSAYARAKRRAEVLVLRAMPAALVLRTGWMYGDGRQNFVQRVLGWAEQQPRIAVVTDEIATPTACVSVAVALPLLLASRPSGILHFTDAGAASRFDWAREILRLAGGDPERVRPARLVDFPEAVPKPPYSVLSTARIEQIGVRPRPWQSAFAAYMGGWRERALGGWGSVDGEGARV